MSKRFFLFLMTIMMIVCTACQAAPTAAPATLTAEPPPPTAVPTAVPPTETPVPAEPVFTLVGLDGATTAFTLEELMALPVTEGYAGIKSSTGRITPPALYRGVALKDLVAVLGVMDETMGVNVVAEDGYAITYSFDQVTNGTFIAYDPATGDELQNAVPLTAIIAYERDGQPLDAKEEGTLRLSIVSAEPNQVTDGHWAVKWAAALELRSVGENWILHLEGALTQDVDRATFESGAAPNCHGVTWTDDKAQEWVGIPLWALVGFVDDEVKHEGPAYNDALADAGYTIDVVASDGYTISFDSLRVKRNDNIIVAYLVNGNPLPDKYYPLRLVGSDLDKSEMVGMVAQIIVHVPALPVGAEATPGPALPPELVIAGRVDQPLEFMEDGLRALEVVQVTATHPNKGTTDTYEGVLLNTLLTMAGVQEGATTVNIVASDGYTVGIPITDVLSCAECLIAFTDTPGDFRAVMPGLDGGTWVKDVARIEVLPIPVVEADLTITGLVAQPLALLEADLRTLEVAQIEALHPKKGTTDAYEGIRLSTLLEMAGVQEGAATLVLTAGDGYAMEISLADASGCADCLIAFTDTPGTFNLIMPGFDGSYWIKDITFIEIK